MYSKHSPAVFYIELYNNAGAPISSGSGIFIESNGIAITNYHVIEGANSAKITLPESKKTYDVEGADYYYFYYQEAGEESFWYYDDKNTGEQIRMTRNSEYSATFYGLENGKKYNIVVTSVKNGVESQDSDVFLFVTMLSLYNCNYKSLKKHCCNVTIKETISCKMEVCYEYICYGRYRRYKRHIYPGTGPANRITF